MIEDYLNEMRKRIQEQEFMDEVRWMQEKYDLDFEEAKERVKELYRKGLK
jgi:hypothetical protein